MIRITFDLKWLEMTFCELCFINKLNLTELVTNQNPIKYLRQTADMLSYYGKKENGWLK